MDDNFTPNYDGHPTDETVHIWTYVGGIGNSVHVKVKFVLDNAREHSSQSVRITTRRPTKILGTTDDRCVPLTKYLFGTSVA